MNNNAPLAQLPAFDEEPIAVDPNLSERLQSDDEHSLLENFGGGAQSRQPAIEKQQTQKEKKVGHKQMIISY